MKNTLCTLISATLLVCGLHANAQCTSGRFRNEIFDVNMTTTTYSTPYSLSMDVYQPVGDTMSARPLIILAHGGSFIAGTRTDDITVDSLCRRFAARGYVTASIDYRLGSLFDMVGDSSLAIDIVIKAISDGKAAIRYFVKDRATTNAYKIDTNNIYVGGNSAGAVLYMHVGYLNDISECPSYIATAMTANGGFEGNSGNDGYTTRRKAVINLAGALNMTSFVDAGDIPSVNVQGSADATVPYNCGYPLSGTVHVNLCGLGQLESAYTTAGVYHMSKVYTGDGHVPWNSDMVKLNTVDSLVKEFLFTLVCPGVSEVNEAIANTHLTIQPNPATDNAVVTASAELAVVYVTDMAGRVVMQIPAEGRSRVQLPASQLAQGLYIIRATFKQDTYAPVTERLIVK